MAEQNDFARLATAALDATAARQRLLETREAVVLERIARGGGATCWYLLRRSDDLDVLQAASAQEVALASTSTAVS